MRAVSVHVTGVVQGVGFRPFVHNLALRLGVLGWVKNTSQGVFAQVEGDNAAVEAFVRALREEAPPAAVVQSVIAEDVEPEGFERFEIVHSADEGGMTLVSPDLATCEACAAELLDPDDRRFRYPFINCTNCGPRFTIIDDIPYDRPATSMREFEMCSACSAEYADPADRRFHAQPDACGECGPRLYFQLAAAQEVAEDALLRDAPLRAALAALPADAAWRPGLAPWQRDREAAAARTDALLAAAEAVIAAGGILALKGLGGFHLACDATNEAAVSRLRTRKHRWGKPLAIMARDLDAVRALADVGPEEAALLGGSVRPIVLLKLRAGETPSPLAPSLAPGLTELGVMLPYTPVHHLLLHDLRRPLVMTSGNLSDEPIATDNGEALQRLSAIADAFLLNDRDIRSRYDDSVARVVAGETQLVRRSRGYAPFPLKAPGRTDAHILGVGPEQKNTFTLLKDEFAFVSQHIGDLENAETLDSFEETLALYERLFRITPELVAHDLHPEYLSTKFALALGLPKIGVQHHHAHIASVTAEHGVAEPVVGVAFDGTGYGTDGRIWGGEVLLGDWKGFERFAHLRYVPMPGGAAAVRRPARMALGLLSGIDPALIEHPGAAAWRSRLAPGEETTLRRMIEREVNSPLTSSMGRLFDAIASLVGIRDDAAYEGQAAIELEAAADEGADGAYAFGLLECDGILIEPEDVIRGILEDLARGVQRSVVAARFHRAVVELIVRIAVLGAKESGARYVALGGGVFMNRLVTAGALREIERVGLIPLTHRELPFNDGAVSFGQAVVAWANRHQV